LLQNEHLGIPSATRRWPNMIPVWRRRNGSQDRRKFNVALLAAKAF
jgi:hypothetical protein